MNEQKTLLTKWLRNLLHLHIASLLIVVVNAITGLESFTRWVSWATSVGVILCLFRLQNVNQRYQKAAIFQAVVLGGSVASTLFDSLALLGTVASVCGIVAGYQEYHAHSELVAEVDDRLSRKWSGLFLWSLALGLVSGFASTALVTIGVLAEADVVMLAAVAVAVVLLSGAVVEILYLRYMDQTLNLLEKDA